MSAEIFVALDTCEPTTSSPEPPPQPLPAKNRRGEFPYHLSLSDVLGEDRIADIEHSGKIVFHMFGDQGFNEKSGDTDVQQKEVTKKMALEFEPGSNPNNPSFLYIVGDIIYPLDLGGVDGDAQYKRQFYDTHESYKAPIFAVPGSHDGQIPPDGNGQATEQNSLDSLMRHFCDQEADAKYNPERPRGHMRQPNCFWTLDCPFVRIIGLYSNSPDCGDIEPEQEEWLRSELSAPRDKALILACYFPIYGSINAFRGSVILKTKVDAAIEASGRRAPDMFISGRYHCYQHLIKIIKKLGVTEERHYVIAGTGGKPTLERPRTRGGHNIQDGAMDPHNGVRMQFSLKAPGYVRITVTRDELKEEFFAVREKDDLKQPCDSFIVKLNGH